MFSDLAELFRLIIFVLLKGGWVGFVVGLVYMFYRLYIDYIQLRWYKQQKWIFLNVMAPKENEKSPLAFEQIFNQLHAIHATHTFAETYLEGRFDIWFTWEIVGIGGTISNIVQIRERDRDILEAAVYAQYPEAEITETFDYFDKLPKYNADTSDFDIFAFSFIKKREDAYPIRTYLEFEHATADTFVDPVDGVWEELGRLNPHEMFIIQYMIRPVDDDWKEKGYKLVEKLKGVPDAEHEGSLIVSVMGKIFAPLLDILIRPDAGETKPRRVVEAPPSLMLHRTDEEKAVIQAIERHLARNSYKVKIRCMYLAPKEKYNPRLIYSSVIGAFKSVRATNLNALKPDTDHWTKVRYWLLKDLEKPIVDLRTKFRKRRFWGMIRRRWFFWGRASYSMDPQELATILHFPRTEVVVPRIEKVSVTKVQPPPELPMAP